MSFFVIDSIYIQSDQLCTSIWKGCRGAQSVKNIKNTAGIIEINRRLYWRISCRDGVRNKCI